MFCEHFQYYVSLYSIYIHIFVHFIINIRLLVDTTHIIYRFCENDNASPIQYDNLHSNIGYGMTSAFGLFQNKILM